MTIEGESAGDVLTGAVVAHTIEGASAGKGAGADAVQGTCRNCGATLTGSYCASCGQAAHIHRSLGALVHDMLHGALHFEGKVWRTLPELFLHPGRLTRRYIDGQRARFVSPMALFLFTVFLMFAVFAFTGGPLPQVGPPADTKVILSSGEHMIPWKAGIREGVAETKREIVVVQEQLKASDLQPEKRASLEANLATLQSMLEGMEAVANSDWGKLTSMGGKTPEPGSSGQKDFRLGWSALEQKISDGVRAVESNPQLLLYKLKTNGYKFSWALIPLSMPFMWLMFFWRRDVHMYDHAIFVTYSITFIMQLMVLVSLIAVTRVPAAIWGWAILLVPIHMYRQLRGTYGLSGFGAFVRLVLLMISASIVLVIFTVLLVLLGVLG